MAKITGTVPVSPHAVTARGNIVYVDADGNREWSPRTQRIVRNVSGLIGAGFVILGLGFMADAIPAAPWSPIGQQTQQDEAPPTDPTDLSQYDIPDGWAPAKPDAPTAPVAPRVPTQNA